MTSGRAQPVTAGAFSHDGALFAYAIGYDWCVADDDDEDMMSMSMSLSMMMI